MRKAKKILMLVPALALILSLTACAGGQKSAREALETAMEHSGQESSMSARVVMEAEMKLSLGGEEQTARMLTSVEASMIYEPLKMKMNMSVEIEGQSAMGAELYAQEQDGACMLYLNDGAGWYSSSVDVSDLEGYTGLADLELLWGLSGELAEAGSEELDGTDTYRYTGAFSGEEALQIIGDSGALDSVASLGLDPEEFLDQLTREVSDIPVTVWIGKDACRVVRYEMDMSGAMNDLVREMLAAALGSQAEDVAMEFPAMRAGVDCWDYGAVEDFDIPAEALAA